MNQLILHAADKTTQIGASLAISGTTGMGIPDTLTWASVLTGIGDLLGNTLVEAAIVAVLALRFGPRVIKAVLSATRGR